MCVNESSISCSKSCKQEVQNGIEKIDSTIKASDYVVHHIDKTKKMALENGERIQLTDHTNCVLLPKINGDSNVIHQAVHAALVCGDLDHYIQTLKQCEVIKENEDKSISRVPLEDLIKNSIK